MRSIFRFALLCAFAAPLAACAAIFGFEDLVGTPPDDSFFDDAETPEDAGGFGDDDGGDATTAAGDARCAAEGSVPSADSCP